LCYAKITPAALRRGEFAAAGREGAEALGPNPKFKPGGWRPVTVGARAPTQEMRWLAAS
jgi:hypothetical protein